MYSSCTQKSYKVAVLQISLVKVKLDPGQEKSYQFAVCQNLKKACYIFSKIAIENDFHANKSQFFSAGIVKLQRDIRYCSLHPLRFQIKLQIHDIPRGETLRQKSRIKVGRAYFDALGHIK